jgi:hypothetical protein
VHACFSAGMLAFRGAWVRDSLRGGVLRGSVVACLLVGML